MAIIDRYLLRQFVKTFVICYVSLTGLYIVFDAFTMLPYTYPEPLAMKYCSA